MISNFYPLFRLANAYNQTFFIQEFLQRAGPIFNSKKSGAFLNSCVIHCQALEDIAWNNYKIDTDNGFTYSVADAIAHWYFDEGCSCESKFKSLIFKVAS